MVLPRSPHQTIRMIHGLPLPPFPPTPRISTQFSSKHPTPPSLPHLKPHHRLPSLLLRHNQPNQNAHCLPAGESPGRGSVPILCARHAANSNGKAVVTAAITRLPHLLHSIPLLHLVIHLPCRVPLPCLHTMSPRRRRRLKRSLIYLILELCAQFHIYKLFLNL
jgi:hypothetical protein